MKIYVVFKGMSHELRLKVSEIEADGCVPLSQTHFAKRGVAEAVPVVDMDRQVAFKASSLEALYTYDIL